MILIQVHKSAVYSFQLGKFCSTFQAPRETSTKRKTYKSQKRVLKLVIEIPKSTIKNDTKEKKSAEAVLFFKCEMYDNQIKEFFQNIKRVV